ncbi:hypothetical protein [Pelovirga terrestris]|uniref:Uncharacterized protein n=1 Tax=Pelovirga terrestris TaxID=2771352 RepID=A0A8J6QP61_9BACT|nr:hypothetical protein [Pelovirga terrestris]MBD1401467.1 hypothetical protein [Pelovirga terrestris]
MKSYILLYEPNIGYHSQLAFLLSVEDISGTYARSSDEALNWLEAIKLGVVSFDLVLIGSWCGTAAEYQLVQNALELQLPVVFLRRGTESSPQLAIQNPIVCDDDNLLSCLNDCLTLKQGETYDRRANDSC